MTVACQDCPNTFATPEAFVKHRAALRPLGGPKLFAGRCHNPDLDGMTQDKDGVWALPEPVGGDAA